MTARACSAELADGKQSGGCHSTVALQMFVSGDSQLMAVDLLIRLSARPKRGDGLQPPHAHSIANGPMRLR
jgi:hypothetical protein